jgi:predicted NUDIX family phosphoesterase
MEFVYVVPREALFPSCYPQGLVRFGQPENVDLEPSWDQQEVLERIRQNAFFVERPYAERSPHLKQIIPYTLVVAEHDELGPRVLLVRRLPQGGEKRLVGKLSIGIGGHINPIDDSVDAPSANDSRDVIAAGAARELDEELTIGGATRLEAVGLINDDANPVGAVHVGLVQVLYVAQGDLQHIQVKEEEVLEGTLVPPAELKRLADEGANFETWSRMLVDCIDQLLSLPHPALS